jgi:hypothetical protein
VNLLGLFLRHDTVMYLRMNCAIISVIYNVAYFSVPGQVEDLSLKPGLHNISVNWSKPNLNSYCVTQCVINWVHTLSGSTDNNRVSSQNGSFVIEDLDACVEYEVSVSAVNEKNESNATVPNYITTETAGNYHVQITVFCL